MLPRDEFIARLSSLTNLRIVEDAAAPEGLAHKVLPFPGWHTVPTW
jgi:hypothetical protein